MQKKLGNFKTFFKASSLSFLYLSIVISDFSFASTFSQGGHVKHKKITSVSIPLITVTQGPFWPPSQLVNEDGDFIVVGSLLKKQVSGAVMAVSGQAAIVSKETIPPLDDNGIEDFSNQLGAPYKVIRHLNLKRGSDDLNIVLHTASFGPPLGNFGGAHRIPREGDSTYNLNAFTLKNQLCPDAFPSESQKYTFMRPSFPLHKAPIWGFLGDNVAYDVDTGEPFIPRLKNGSNCPADGCLGEDPMESRRATPITLGEWLKAKVKLDIKLVNYSYKVEGFTAARFSIKAKGLLPNSIYAVAGVREATLGEGRPLNQLGHFPFIPGVLVSDAKGRAWTSFVVNNPFPEPSIDDAGLRLAGIGIILRSDFSYLGGCPLIFGPGVDAHPVATTFGDGNVSRFNPLITKALP